MKVVVVENYTELSRAAARFVAQMVIKNPRLVLALPTGDTPLGLYRELVGLFREGLLDFSGAQAFNLDEYLGLPPDHPQSFRAYMREHFWSHVNLHAYYIPDSLPADPQEECRRYERIMGEAGGLDLAVLGLGKNGHIAFNEPGTPWESLTHVVDLAEETRREEARRFGGLAHTPKQAITTGIRTIMNARRILLLVAGPGKAGILARALRGPITPEVPGSVLQLHPDLTVIADRAAAAFL